VTVKQKDDPPSIKPRLEVGYTEKHLRKQDAHRRRLYHRSSDSRKPVAPEVQQYKTIGCPGRNHLAIDPDGHYTLLPMRTWAFDQTTLDTAAPVGKRWLVRLPFATDCSSEDDGGNDGIGRKGGCTGGEWAAPGSHLDHGEEDSNTRADR
jgi:hypothetical protein